MKTALIALLLLAITSMTFAQSSTSSAADTSGESAPPQSVLHSILRDKTYQDDAEITDAKLKADEGSRSQYSMKFNLNYNGPPVGDLNSPNQPNPDHARGTYSTLLAGSFGGRVRFSPQSAVSVGTGVRALTPLQGVSRYDVSNPFASYDHSTRVGQVQMRNSFGGVYASNPDYQVVGEVGGSTYDNYVVYNLGLSRWALELDSSVAYYFFNRGYVPKDTTSNRYTLSFFPYVKYNLTDRLNFNSSLAISYWNPRATNDQTVLDNRVLSQRFGLGYAITKDVYVAPYINFYTKNVTADTTTVNFSTTFSLL